MDRREHKHSSRREMQSSAPRRDAGFLKGINAHLPRILQRTRNSSKPRLLIKPLRQLLRLAPFSAHSAPIADGVRTDGVSDATWRKETEAADLANYRQTATANKLHSGFPLLPTTSGECEEDIGSWIGQRRPTTVTTVSSSVDIDNLSTHALLPSSYSGL